MDDNTRSINKINEQIKFLNSEPRKEKKTKETDIIENDDTVIVDKIEDIDDKRVINDNEDTKEEIIVNDHNLSKKQSENEVVKENYVVLYLIVVILLIILGILIYFL